MLDKSTSTRVIKNTIFLYIRMGVSIVVSVFTTRILLSALGASDYGLYNVVAGALAMTGFLSASLSTSTQRFISYAEGEGEASKIKEIVNTSVILHWIMALSVGSLFIICGFIFFNGILNIPEGRELTAILVYGCLIVSTVFSITVVPYEALLNAHENMLYYSILGIMDVLFKLFIAIVVSYSSWDRLLFYGLLMAAEAFLLCLITKRYCLRHYSESHNISLKRIPNKEQLLTMTSFAGWNMLNIGSGMISLYGMNIVINHFFGTILNAAVGIANQLAGVLLGVSNNMTRALTPVLVKSEGSKKREQMLKITYIGSKFTFLLYSFFCIPVLFYTPTLLEIWLKEVPEWTILFTRLMILFSLIDQMFVFLYQTIQAQGDIRNYNIIHSIVNILPIPLGIFQYYLGWAPYWIIIDQIVFRVTVGGLINLYYAKRNAGLSIKRWIVDVLAPCFSTVAVTCIIGLGISVWGNASLLQQLIKLFSLFVLSIPVYWFLSITPSEKSLIISKLRKK